MRKITLLPSHPDEGSLSMLRYWGLADKHLSINNNTKYEVKSLLNPELARLKSSSNRWKRAYSKYLAYPLKVKTSNLGNLVHILDHSSSHLLKYIGKDVKKVVTVHDIIPLYSNEEISAKQLSRFKKVLSYLDYADQIIADSEYTKDDLIKYLGITEKKIKVSLLGVDMNEFTHINSIVKDEHSDEPIILSVGGDAERKNLQIYPELMKLLKNRIPTIRFWRVGSKMKDEYSKKLRVTLGANFVEYGRISDEELARLYRTADVLVVPSHYEGFGLPVLEGMASGCPVVSSNQSSLPEVAKDNAHYFHPQDVKEASQVIGDLLLNEVEKERLRIRGLARAKALNWQKHFDEVREIYEILLSES